MAARDIVTKDFGWKLLSFVLAIVVWLACTMNQQTGTGASPLALLDERIFSDLPVNVTASAADVRAFRVHPSSVDIVVRGRPEVIRALTAREIRVTVDLTDIESAEDLTKRVDVAVPPGVTLVEASPSLVDVVIPPK